MRCTLAALILLASPALAHDHARSDLDEWFQSLKSGNGPCCDGPGVDATHLEDPDWRVVSSGSETHYEVRRSGEWERVPDSAVLRQPNRYGKALVWYVPWNPTVIRCFMPGVLG